MIKMTSGAESLMITNSVRAIIQREDISTYDFTTLPEYKTTLDKISQKRFQIDIEFLTIIHYNIGVKINKRKVNKLWKRNI